MVPHPVAVSPNIDDMAVVDEPVDQGTGHDFIAEDFAPLLEALVRGKDCSRVLVALLACAFRYTSGGMCRG